MVGATGGKNRILLVSPKPGKQSLRILTSEASRDPQQNAGRPPQTLDLSTAASAWANPELQQRPANRVSFLVRKGPLVWGVEGRAMEPAKVCLTPTPEAPGGRDE